MEIIDAFNSDLFKTTSLVDSINHDDHKPTRLGELGLFEVEPIATTSVVIEEEYGVLNLVPAGPRGGVPDPQSRERRKAISFEVPHLATMTEVMAAEVQNVRAFGQGNNASGEMMAVEQVRDKKLNIARNNLDATVEYHRIGAVRGQILDADGTSVLLDLFTAFNKSQTTYGMDLDESTTKITAKIRVAQRLALSKLGGSSAFVRGWLAICGDEFFDTLVGHPKLEDKFLNQQGAQALRDIAPYSTFSFGNTTWENYRGQVGSVAFVPSTKAYLVPLGVPRLFRHYLAPADYMETVNTLGLPFYAKAEMKKMNKGIDIEAQTNPLLLCTRPDAIVELDMIAGSPES